MKRDPQAITVKDTLIAFLVSNQLAQNGLCVYCLMLLVSQTGWLRGPHWGWFLICVDSCSVPSQNHAPGLSSSMEHWVLEHGIIPWRYSIYQEGCKFGHTNMPLWIPGQLYAVKYRSSEMRARTIQQVLCGFSPFSFTVVLRCLSGCTKGSLAGSSVKYDS